MADYSPTEDKGAGTALSEDDRVRLDRFMKSTTLFLGPDPEIMRDHSLAPRSPLEERALAAGVLDDHEAERIRGRLYAALDESFEMVEQMGAAPGAKWGDLVTGIYTAAGDLTYVSARGLVAFSAVLHYPIRFIVKNWLNEPTVGVRDGDGFIHNDSRYGTIHNTDQSLIMPVFHEGELIAWVAAVVHEGENGAIEPGGMPSMSESPYDEGLKMSPFKIVENYEIKKDLLTFLQNSVREPKLQYEDIKVKLFACLRVKERIEETLQAVGPEKFAACLRKNMEDIEAEVRRRVRELPDGTVRTQLFVDSTLRENVIYKFSLAVTVKGDEITFDLRGSSPQFNNRSMNTVLGSMKSCIMTSFLYFIWPDLPHGIAVIAPMKILTDRGSVIDCTDDVPNAQSLQTCFKTITTTTHAMQKLLYSCPTKYTKILAPWFNQINTFLFGGITQHNELVGNVCADLNGMGGGARADRDGENGMAPHFAAMADTGEQEIIEDEVPFLQLVSKKMKRDNQAFGKYRGGMGYEMLVASRGSPMWGFMTVSSGSKIPPNIGLFGGYGSPTYPLCKIKDVNVFEVFKSNPEAFDFSIEDLMNKRSLPGATYSTHHMGMGFELAREGECYMICQGTGGGYGDPLERDPAAVVRDLEDGLISPETVRDIYHVVVDPASLVLDAAATEAARQAEREARRRRGRPYAEFVRDWTVEAPPADLPYYGSWSDPKTIYAGRGADRVVMDADNLQPVFMANPKDVEIAALRARLAELSNGVRA